MRRPALIVATVALAVTPALTTAAPVHAAPRTPVVAAEELSVVEMILSSFPAPMAAQARLILTGDLNAVWPFFTEALKLTPTQIGVIFAKFQEVLALLGGIFEPAPTDPAPTDPALAALQNRLAQTGTARTGADAANVLLATVLASR